MSVRHTRESGIQHVARHGECPDWIPAASGGRGNDGLVSRRAAEIAEKKESKPQNIFLCVSASLREINAKIRRRVHRRLTDEQRQQHRQIREQVEKEKAALRESARAKELELNSLRDALGILKHEREARGLSLAEVSKRSGIDKSRLSKLETADHPNPTLDTLTRIASAIGVRLTIGVTAA